MVEATTNSEVSPEQALENQLNEMLSAAGEFIKNKPSFVELKSFARPPDRVKTIGDLLYAFVKDSKKRSFEWKTVAKEVISPGALKLNEINMDALTPNQIAVLAEAAQVDDLRPYSSAAELIRVFLLEAHKYVTLKSEMAA